jgi:hypothetical protein
MKCKVFLSVILFGFLMLPLARAQMNEPIQGNIPFDFHVGDTAVPAGNYRISSYALLPQILLLEGLDKKPMKILISMSMGLKSNSATKKPLLIFHRYGRAYFLSEVWQGLGDTEGFGLRPSRVERVKAREVAAVPTPHNVELATVIFTVR